jgi:hypothetical protein
VRSHTHRRPLRVFDNPAIPCRRLMFKDDSREVIRSSSGSFPISDGCTTELQMYLAVKTVFQSQNTHFLRYMDLILHEYCYGTYCNGLTMSQWAHHVAIGSLCRNGLTMSQ